MNRTEIDAIAYLSKWHPGLVRSGLTSWVKMALTGMCGNPAQYTEIEMYHLDSWPVPDASRMLRFPAINSQIEPYDLLIECVEVVTTNRMTKRRIDEYGLLALVLFHCTGIYMRVIAFHSDTKAHAIVVDGPADQLVTLPDCGEVLSMARPGQIKRAVKAYNAAIEDDSEDYL